jgi:hypothetical protein
MPLGIYSLPIVTMNPWRSTEGAAAVLTTISVTTRMMSRNTEGAAALQGQGNGRDAVFARAANLGRTELQQLLLAFFDRVVGTVRVFFDRNPHSGYLCASRLCYA